MATAAEHYDNHLAKAYVWMAGGSDAALRAGSAEIESLNLPVAKGTVALDLGAGEEPFEVVIVCEVIDERIRHVWVFPAG